MRLWASELSVFVVLVYPEDERGAGAGHRVPRVTDVGRRVPELELRDDSGRPWRLDADRDHPLLLILHRHFY